MSFDTGSPALWFRLYAEFAVDPKVQMLSELDQRRYIMLLCLRCSNGDVTLHDSKSCFCCDNYDTVMTPEREAMLERGMAQMHIPDWAKKYLKKRF